MAECGAPSPWGTSCDLDEDHNDHTNHIAPRWWRTDDRAPYEQVALDLLREFVELVRRAEYSDWSIASDGPVMERAEALLSGHPAPAGPSEAQIEACARAAAETFNPGPDSAPQFEFESWWAYAGPSWRRVASAVLDTAREVQP